ncbi:MAG: hypothetical protein Q8O42_14915 [Acidobacteriota bacterium]|nr:hypothetical protein [Acidobacteriota bacterium]
MFAALHAPSIPAAALVDVARAFTPRFEQVGPLVLLDAGGLSRLFGSPHELGAYLQEALNTRQGVPPRQHPQPRVAVAFTQAAAALLALGRPGLTVVEPGREEKALAPLGIGVLDRYEKLRVSASDTRHLEILTKWGIRTLGAFAALAGPEVFERLGDRGLRWQALARGVDARPLVPWVDEVPFEAALELEWPIEGLEPLSFVLARLFEPLSERLEQADRGAAVIYTSLCLTTKRVHSRTLPLPSPMRDAKTLRTLVLLDLETHPPDAPIDTVRVCIEPTPGRVLQWTLLERAQPAPEQVSTLVARLGALMGDTHVGSPRLQDTWKPGAFEMARFEIAEPGAPMPTPSPTPDPSIGSALRRFRFPVPTRVTVQEGRPIRVATDRQGFSSGAIVQSAGPWRTSGEWWQEGQAWDRDEWDVAMADGTIYRLVVERGVGQWFLEGVVD